MLDTLLDLSARSGAGGGRGQPPPHRWHRSDLQQFLHDRPGWRRTGGGRTSRPGDLADSVLLTEEPEDPRSRSDPGVGATQEAVGDTENGSGPPSVRVHPHPTDAVAVGRRRLPGAGREGPGEGTGTLEADPAGHLEHRGARFGQQGHAAKEAGLEQVGPPAHVELRPELASQGSLGYADGAAHLGGAHRTEMTVGIGHGRGHDGLGRRGQAERGLVIQGIGDESRPRTAKNASAAGSEQLRSMGQRSPWTIISRTTGATPRVRARPPASGTRPGSKNTETVRTAVAMVVWCRSPARNPPRLLGREQVVGGRRSRPRRRLGGRTRSGAGRGCARS